MRIFSPAIPILNSQPRGRILLIFAAAFAVMIYGVAVLDGGWQVNIRSLSGFCHYRRRDCPHGEEAFTSTFIDGARDLLGVALIIGIASPVSWW